MGVVWAAVAFSTFAVILEVVLIVLGAPLWLLVVVGIVLAASDWLLVDWEPWSIVAAAGAYLSAVAIGVIGFSIIGLGVWSLF